MTRLLIFTCFFASGACGLAYEVLWTRMLTLVFGTTVYSTSVVLTVFMAGLGLGAALGGRYADRLRNPLRAYGILEVAIGLYCFFTPSLVRGIEALYAGWAVPAAPTAMLALRAGLSFLALIPPTVLMGATLPMLSRFFVERMVGAHSGAYADGGHSPPYAGDAQSAPYRAVGGEVGRLYGINTAGAAFGCFAAGFISVPAFGVTWTVWTAAGLNVVIGLAAIALARGDFGLRISDFGLNGTRNAQYAIRNTEHASPAFADATADQRLASTPPTINHLPSTIVLAAIGLSGFAALAYEVAWTRSLCIVFGTTVYAFSSMLTAFLVGLALGGWLFSWLARGAVRRGGLVGQVGQMETAPLF
ncbi:MAG: hypothetical protein FJ279_26665, partial [Planctomycetes bacterium]|nr:hypothetical protein [Planctomycetota bacterium]